MTELERCHNHTSSILTNVAVLLDYRLPFIVTENFDFFCTMAPRPPSYGSQEYWNDRFTANKDPFEWLEAPDALDSYILEALRNAYEASPELLHIGCGTSLLSYHLRSHVKDPHQVHNLDYSPVAVDLGKQREIDIFRSERRGMPSMNEDASTSLMRWSSVDLLNHTSLLRSCQQQRYSVIVDKSTSDCIACSDDVDVMRPYPVLLHSDVIPRKDGRYPSEPIHPLFVLAVNLALVARPRARWITLSYSFDRFSFLDEDSSEYSEFPKPGVLWRVISKHEVVKDTESAPHVSGEQVTYRPVVPNWIYVLERTDVPLVVRT